MFLINTDLITLKDLYTLLETVELEGFLLGNIKEKELSIVINKLLKSSDVLEEMVFLLTGEKEVTIKGFVKILSKFIKKNKKILDNTSVVSEALSTIKGKGTKDNFNTDNVYLSTIFQLGMIGNFDCSKLNLDEAMFFIYKNNKQIERQNEQLKKK